MNNFSSTQDDQNKYSLFHRPKLTKCSQDDLWSRRMCPILKQVLLILFLFFSNSNSVIVCRATCDIAQHVGFALDKLWEVLLKQLALFSFQTKAVSKFMFCFPFHSKIYILLAIKKKNNCF